MTADSAGDDSVAATLGFVLAGAALVAAFLDWTPAVAMYGVPSLPGAITAGLTTGVLLLRRHGVLDRTATPVAILGFVGVVASGAAALLLPGIAGTDATAGVGVFVAILVGVVGVGVAYADFVGMQKDALLGRVRDGLLATGIGVGGLFFGYLLVFAIVGILGPFIPSGLQNSLVTAVFSVGLGLVAAGYALQRPEGLDYFDIRMPDKRGWIHVVLGLVAMFAVLLVGGVVSTMIGLPSAQHGIIQQAQQNPAILLPLIPLSLLAIGPGEELLNRNVVQKSLYGAYSRWGAVLVATLIFTIIHVPAYGIGATPAALFVTLVRLFLVSLVLGIVYERTENVVVAALVHGGFDAIQFGAAYLLITNGMA